MNLDEVVRGRGDGPVQAVRAEPVREREQLPDVLLGLGCFFAAFYDSGGAGVLLPGNQPTCPSLAFNCFQFQNISTVEVLLM